MTTTTNCTTASCRLSGALATARNHVLPENRRNQLNLGYLKTSSGWLKVIEIGLALLLCLVISTNWRYNGSAMVAPAYTAAAVGICFLINKIARESDNQEETTGSLFAELMLVSINAVVFLFGGVIWTICALFHGYTIGAVFTTIVLGIIYTYDASMVMRKWNNKDVTNQQQPTEVVAVNSCPARTTVTAEEDIKDPPPTFEESSNHQVYFPRY
uniref:MARVEL domain-containing protein n=1 Tax=Plectus sambesii TaxID=2011161 RepID=A0A914WVL5_9BILA